MYSASAAEGRYSKGQIVASAAKAENKISKVRHGWNAMPSRSHVPELL